MFIILFSFIYIKCEYVIYKIIIFHLLLYLSLILLYKILNKILLFFEQLHSIYLSIYFIKVKLFEWRLNFNYFLLIFKYKN